MTLSSRENCGWLPTQKRSRPKDHTPLQERSPRLAETAQRRPKVLPSCGNRATRATLHKTTQRGLPAYKYTYPVVVESSRGYKLGNRVQPGVTAGAGYASHRRLPRRGIVACGQRKLTLRIEIQRQCETQRRQVPPRHLPSHGTSRAQQLEQHVSGKGA